MKTVTIPADRNGPRSSGNGGWTAGALAAQLNPNAAITVALRQPPPLDVPLPTDVNDNTATMRHHVTGKTVATATPAAPGWQKPAIPSIDAQHATTLAPHYPGASDHPFPTCFVCGLDRTDAVAMRLTPAPTTSLAESGHPITACVWTVPDQLDDPTLWAAVDCPGGWSVDLVGRPMVLGTMTAQIHQRPKAGETAVIMGGCLTQDDTKATTQTSLWVGDTLCVEATAVWVAVDPDVFNRIQQG